MSKIIKLQSENVKRLQAVEIAPDGNLVVIGGKNGAGKSSVLDSIEFALGGDPSAKMPVRKGEEKARIVVDLGDIVVQRTFTAAGGTSLVVKNSDGAKLATPQAILDKLVGKLAFDPLSFARHAPKEQAVILRELVGLDFTKLDAERLAAFNERTSVNRHIKSLEAAIADVPKQEGLPKEELSGADILAAQKKASDTNAENQKIRRDYASAVQARKDAEAKVNRCSVALNDANLLLQQMLEQENVFAAKVGQLTDADADLAPFQAKLREVENVNALVRQAKRRDALVQQLKAKSAEADKLTAAIEALDANKRKATTAARYPVDGLEFDTAGGVTFQGIPFEQCSSAEQLRVSVAIGMALNPKLRVLLIRDGSLMDTESMKVLAEMAAAADAQVWIERVGSDAHTSVLIEDGSVVAPS